MKKEKSVRILAGLRIIKLRPTVFFTREKERERKGDGGREGRGGEKGVL
jgi:hypothetical protein